MQMRGDLLRSDAESVGRRFSADHDLSAEIVQPQSVAIEHDCRAERIAVGQPHGIGKNRDAAGFVLDDERTTPLPVTIVRDDAAPHDDRFGQQTALSPALRLQPSDAVRLGLLLPGVIPSVRTAATGRTTERCGQQQANVCNRFHRAI